MRFLQFLFLLLPFLSKGQTADTLIGYSRAEKLAMRPGGFVKISFDTIGTTPLLHVGGLTVTDVNSAEKENAVCFIGNTLANSISFSVSNIQVSASELNQLLAAIKKINIIANGEEKSSETFYRYTSNNLIVFQIEKRPINNKWDFTIARRYKHSDTLIEGGSVLTLRKKDFEMLEKILEVYKFELSQKGAN
jgi:hypothetical protein